MADLPSLWTHEPHNVLAFKPGDKVSDIDTHSTPGFTGSKADAPDLQAERNARFAELQEMLYANSKKGDTPPQAGGGTPSEARGRAPRAPRPAAA